MKYSKALEDRVKGERGERWGTEAKTPESSRPNKEIQDLQ